ncbi:hypothetical protein [Actinomycetospora lemnae]|uniref:Lsr2 protein n=1 Tax=Actinomycetospora lemnae TaxID=3019891 RepID=A0ABT5SMD0_9PSEU|nr:hypothetical protein [Actinomycetospora sp. DW7H6]MDD7963984.1 hypothetical protein [Actinomycetospora sp. DW7H6]
MSDEKREPTAPRERHDADEPVRQGNVHGFVEAARMWARQKGLAVPANGPLPHEIVAQYKRHQTWE